MFERIKKIIAEQLALSTVEHLELDSNLIEELDADSLNALEIIMAIEDEFDIEIPDEEVANLKSIGDLIEYINKHTN